MAEMNMEKFRELLMKGYITRTVKVLDVEFQLRSLTTRELVVITGIKEHAVKNRFNMSEEMFRNLDSLLKLTFAFIKFKGENFEPVLEPATVKEFASQLMGLKPLSTTDFEKFIEEVVIPRLEQVMDLPPMLYDYLVEAWNDLQKEFNELLQSDIKNSLMIPGPSDTSGQLNTELQTDTSSIVSSDKSQQPTPTSNES